jgi:hypothetical protein
MLNPSSEGVKNARTIVPDEHESGSPGTTLTLIPARLMIASLGPTCCGLAAAAIEQRFDISGDEPRTALVAQIKPRPLCDNDDAVAETDQIEDVHA